MTFEPSASQAQIDARQHAFDNQPDPATLVSREEIRAALLDRDHSESHIHKYLLILFHPRSFL